jgi:hypothetical protein
MESCDQRIGKSGSGDIACEPGAGAAGEHIDDTSRGRHCDDGQSRGSGLEKGIGHTLVAG